MTKAAVLRGLGVREAAPGVYQLHGPVPHLLNAFFLAPQSEQPGVLVDARTVVGVRRLARQLDGLAGALGGGPAGHHPLGLHALTHVHPDHNGASSFVCRTFGVPLWVGAGDADVAEGKIPLRIGPTWSPLHALPYHRWSGPSHPVARRLVEGDALLDTGFIAVACPGHTAGHTSFWREHDRVLICGDAVAHFHLGSPGRPCFSLPPRLFNADDAEVRRSVVRLASLRPRILLFGHGQPCDNTNCAFERYAEALDAA